MIASACAPPTVQSRDAGVTVAQWRSGTVTADEVDAAARKLPGALREQFLTPYGKRQFTQSVLAKKLLFAEAKRQGFDRAPEVADEVRELEERLSIQALLDAENKKAAVPSEHELHAYFDTHPAEFKVAARVRIGRVQLAGDPKDKKLLARIELLRQRLLRGEPLSRVAKEGEGLERVHEGELGWVSRPDDAQSKAALSLNKVGEVSAVIAGVHDVAVVVLLERLPEQSLDFESSRAQIIARLEPTRQRKTFDDLVSRLMVSEQAQLVDAGVK